MTHETFHPLRAALLLSLLCLIVIALSGWGFWELSHIWWPTGPEAKVQLSEKSLLARESSLLAPATIERRQDPNAPRFRMENPQILAIRPGELAVSIHPQNAPKYRFVGMPLDELAQLVAEWSGLNYRPDPSVRGAVNRSYDFGDPLQLLSDAAHDIGYDMKMLGREIFLEKPTHDITEPKVYVRAMKNFHPPENISLIGSGPSRGILLDSVDNQMEELLRGVLSRDAFVRYDSQRNLVTATDTEVHLRLLNALLEKLDRGQPLVTVSISIYEVQINKFHEAKPDWEPVLKRFGGAKAYAESIELMNRILSGEDVTGSLAPTSRHGVILPAEFTTATMNHTQSIGFATLRSQFFCSSSLDKGVNFIQNRKDFFEAGDDPGPSSQRIFPLDVSATILPGAMSVLRITPSLAALKARQSSDQTSETEAVTTRVPVGRSFVIGGVADTLLPGALEWSWNISNTTAKDPPPPGGFGMARDKDIILIAEPIVFDPTDALSIETSIRWLRRMDEQNLFSSGDSAMMAGPH